ncbi:MAG: hypothetical protein L0211_11455 [Planctomycetaceae bacterium]|nr:hypothetical protein [Planctomycetaceae bacterium]
MPAIENEDGDEDEEEVAEDKRQRFSLLSSFKAGDYNDASSSFGLVVPLKDAVMRWIAPLTLVFWLALGPVSLAQAQFGRPPAALDNRDEDQIRNWYRDYLGREVGPELKAWVELLRGGMSPLDVQATILGSDEFYNEKGRNAQTFIIETLQSITWEEPSAAEVRRWTDRLRALRGDRFSLAREILLAYADDSGVGEPSSVNLSEVANRLSEAAKLLTDTIKFEIGGTTQGRQANLKAQALVDAAEQLRRSTGVSISRPGDASQARAAIASAERSLTSLQATLSSPAGTAPSATSVARRIGDMLEEAQLSLDSGSGLPATPSRPNLPSTSRQLMTQVEAASRAVESIIQSLTGTAQVSYSSGVVVRDLDAMAARLDQLATTLAGSASRERLGWEVEALQAQAEGIEPQLLAGRPAAYTRLYWSSVTSSLEQMGETLGLAPGDRADVLRPTPAEPEVLPLVDQAIARAEVFLTGTQPLVFGVTEVPRVQRDVRGLKSRLLTLRQEAQSGEPATRQLETLTSMVASYQNAFTTWNQIVNRYRLQNPPRLSPIGESLNEVERLLKEAANLDDLTPATGSVASARVARLLATLGDELRLFRESLPLFVNYPEHRPLLTYCDQLEGYFSTLGELQQNTAAAPDAMRRQAAAMQRTVELLAVTAENVEQRARGAGGRAVEAGNRLAIQARRLASLANDLESELH